MELKRSLHDITGEVGSFDRAAFFEALARDTVYLPSELAARLLPIDTRHDTPRWIPVSLAADLRAPAR
ncbi:MAG: hypothetical protein ABI601_09760 [bacterium]